MWYVGVSAAGFAAGRFLFAGLGFGFRGVFCFLVFAVGWCVVDGFFAGLAVEGEYVTVGGVIFEVDDGAGVDGYAHVASLEVEVRAGAAACVSAFAYELSGFDLLSGSHEVFRHVSVDCLKAVVVADHYIVAVTSAVVAAMRTTPSKAAFIESPMLSFMSMPLCIRRNCLR